MRTSFVLRISVAAFFVAVVAGQAAAQPSGSAGGEGPRGEGRSGQVPFSRKTTLTPQEQLQEGGKHLQRMEGAAQGVRKMLGEARKQRDVVKTLCLNDKTSQIDVAVRSGKERLSQLEGAVKRNDTELSNHNFTVITVLRQRAEQLVAESNQCIGEEAAFIGDTKTTFTVDPQIPPDEAPYPPVTDPTVVIGPPQCTSCTK